MLEKNKKNENAEKKFEYIEINGIKVPVLGTLNSKTEIVTFVDGAEEYLEKMKNNNEENKK